MQKPRHPDSLRSVLLLSAFSLSLILTQSGCPQGAELENPEAWAGRFSTSPTGGSGGGTAGTGMMGPVLDFATVDCAASLLKPTGSTGIASADFMIATCGKSFCHGANFVVGLDLRPDSGFAARTLDVFATHAGIPCPDDITMECIPATCPAPNTVKIIDSTDPTASWILKKVHKEQGECGDPMPDVNGLSGDKEACMTNIVNAAAALK
jgi:hypothetical protein